MKNLKYTKVKDILEFLKIIGYNWNGIIVKDNLLQIATIEDFKDTVCLPLTKDNKTENINIEVDDFQFYLENHKLQKFNYDNLSTMWQAYMIYHKSKDYSKLLYTKTLSDKQEVEKTYNDKINLTQKLLDRYKFEKSYEISKLNTILYNIEHKKFSIENEEQLKDL